MRWGACLLLTGCATVLQPGTEIVEIDQALADWCPADTVGLEERVAELVSQMTLDEKAAQMAGSGPTSSGAWGTPGVPRLAVSGFRMVDGPRGVAGYAGPATAFPVGMARGATWDPELERRVGAAMGLEAAARGANVLLAPTINVLRHPRWGRAQETYGEDPLHLGVIAEGFVSGVQEHVLASAKHFAANSIENTRFDVDVTVDERALREIYLPHFRRVVQHAHVASVMSAYNQVNSTYCGENEHLLRTVLKEDWGFLGFVESDWVLGVHSTVPSALAGLDLEMPGPVWFGDRLAAAVRNGEIDEAVLDEAVSRLVRAELCFVRDEVVDPAVVQSAEHLALAREVAARSMVLLTNRELALPLPESVREIVVTGPLADVENIGDEGSSAVEPSEVITPLEGLTAALGEAAVHHVPGTTLPESERARIRAADAVVIVVGFTSADEGESFLSAGDRERMELTDAEEAHIREVSTLNSRTIVVLQGSGAVITEDWIDAPAAVLMSWYPGSQGGHGLADVLLGADPTGRLPVVFAVSEDDLPVFDPVSLEVTYDRWHGYRHLDRNGVSARFPFGFGLSYTTWEIEELALESAGVGPDDTVRARAELINTGSRVGRQTLQLYALAPAGDVHDRAPKELVAFAGATLQPGTSTTVDLSFGVGELARWEDGVGHVVDPGEYTLQLGTHADEVLATVTLTVR